MLQTKSIFGGEAKPLPYLLAQMNLLLHGLEFPQIDPLNSLRFPAERDWRPGPGGHHPHQSAFRWRRGAGHPQQLSRGQADLGDALLFLQLIMRKLRRQPKPGRAGIVVPNGTLFGDGVCARSKKSCSRSSTSTRSFVCPTVSSRHTPASRRTCCSSTVWADQGIWYYEQPLPEGRKQYTKTAPIQYEEFADCLAWWRPEEREGPVADVLRYDDEGDLLSANLDVKNPKLKGGH